MIQNRLTLIVIIVVLSAGCGKEEPIEVIQSSSDVDQISDGGIIELELESESKLHLLKIGSTDSYFTIEAIQAELGEIRKNHRQVIITLDLLYYNICFEKKSYAEMRLWGYSQNSFPCRRVVNRKYFLEELFSEGSAILKQLYEKEEKLLELYDEAQLRGISPQLAESFKEIETAFNTNLKQAYLHLEQVRQSLEDGSYQIPMKDWQIGDTDNYMGFKP